MALLLVDASTAANLATSLQIQASSNIDAILYPRPIDKHILLKPLPLLPAPPHPLATPLPVLQRTTQRKIASQTTLGKRRPVLMSGAQEPVRTSPTSDAVGAHTIPHRVAKDLAENMFAESHTTRTSSVYSTDSMSSDSSRETTISDIVELYTDLVSKINYEEGISDIQILQPKAYRDTVAPLLEKRFSNESLVPLRATAPRSLPLPKTKISDNQVEYSPQLNNKQAPAFQEFSRNLRERRIELVSPLSASSSKYSGQRTSETISEPSPISSPETRPFTFRTSLEIIGNAALEGSEMAPPMPNLRPENNFQHILEPHVVAQTVQKPRLEEPHQAVRAIQSAEGTHHPHHGKITASKSRPHLAAQYMFPPSAEQKCKHNPHSQIELSRYHQNISVRPSLPSSANLYIDVDKTNDTMIRDSSAHSHLVKQRQDHFLSNPEMHPGIPIHPLDLMSSSAKRDGSSMPDNINMTGRGRSWPRVHMPHQPVVMPPSQDQYRAAVSVVSPRQHGIDIEQAEKQVKGRGRRGRRQKAHQLDKDEMPRQLRISLDITESGHQRTVSAQSHESVGSVSSHSKKNSLMAALESARHSFTQSSADKRREKIKESIIVVGPTQLTVANAISSAKSF